MMAFRNNYSSANNFNINMSCIHEMYITSVICVRHFLQISMFPFKKAQLKTSSRFLCTNTAHTFRHILQLFYNQSIKIANSGICVGHLRPAQLLWLSREWIYCGIIEHVPGVFHEANSCWRHQMETFSALLFLYEGNPPITGRILLHRPLKRSFEVFFVL